MIVWNLTYIVDILLWCIMAVSVFYVAFFAFASILPLLKHHHRPTPRTQLPRFLVLFPAYNEDSVICNSIESFLQQDYPKELYEVVVISDHMKQETNEWLSQQPITLLQPSFEKSSKAKALQFAIHHYEASHLSPLTSHFVVILDADNVVAPDFLSRLSRTVHPDEAIQCHRSAKNANNDIAALDGISEEINNSIFRRGHNRIGLSSALIGSGMCFNYDWFCENVDKLDSAVEDRELEALLLKQRIFIRYSEDVYVMDEKVSNQDNFQRQRLRWMTGQVQAFFRMLPYIPKAIVTFNINYIDKTIQQALIPRSILLVLTTVLALLSTVVGHFSSFTSHLSILNSQFSILRWWFLLAILCLALFIAIPRQLRTKAIFSKALILPQLVWRMLKNIQHIKPQNKEFLHTTHGAGKELE